MLVSMVPEVTWGELLLSVSDLVSALAKNLLAEEPTGLHMGDGEPILATASSSGHIAFWDLNTNASLLHITRGAHDGSITGLEWIPGQPLLLTSGDDNSVKVRDIMLLRAVCSMTWQQWLFDSPTAPPRLLKFRGGHQMPPHLIRYYGTDGKQLLTASRDRSLRCLSVVRDSRSFEMSQGIIFLETVVVDIC